MFDIDTTALSDLLGLRFMGPGNHEGCSVSYAWSVRVEPSFDPWLTFGVAATTPHGGRLAPPVLRFAFVNVVSESGTVVLPEDPVLRALTGIDLFHEPQSRSLDGISYSFAFASLELRGFFRISNPRSPSLVRLETALLSTAWRAAALTKSVRLEQQIRVWESYATRRSMIE
jgi:hypothetical protein